MSISTRDLILINMNAKAHATAIGSFFAVQSALIMSAG
jgi:hypothetical protein